MIDTSTMLSFFESLLYPDMPQRKQNYSAPQLRMRWVGVFMQKAKSSLEIKHSQYLFLPEYSVMGDPARIKFSLRIPLANIYLTLVR
ncbi:hypothetical protein I7I53_11622 [Histoplasma capsulatum var. duboisii H88]|uniref:Uncharacterized protein n=1 Tax=Ajellomyces capsulatus (strain H88) TaxID=544711 RepID=A0A8A1LW27_AJEC8|nr:hypothetical protein I7I53_11622 [Histoplasma capsulatum var. duboisii H88]